MGEKKDDGYKEGTFGRDPDQVMPSPIGRFTRSVLSLVDGPVTWFRETVIMPKHKTTKYYHQQFRRVPTVDQCYTDDIACIFEANEQFKRDRKMESVMIGILRSRFNECLFYNGWDEADKCEPLHKEYNDAVLNWFIKYGDLNPYCSVIEAFMKQKHRMIWERREALKQASSE